MPPISQRLLSICGQESSSSYSLLKTMRFVSALVPVLGTCTAFQLRASPSSTWRAMSTTAVSVSDPIPFVKPERVIVDTPLPTVYVYDHCPYCVRVRFALGLKNIKHNLHFLMNDDAATPTALIGKKIAPIFEWPTAQQICMAESLDIIQFTESDSRFGPTQVIKPATDRADIRAWQKSVQDLLRGLQRPRYVATGLLPEFQQLDGRHAFIKNHQLPPWSKSEWRNDISLEERIAHYEAAFFKDPASDIEELNRKLVELNDVLFSEHHCSEGGLSYDDIDLFSRLRSVTIIKDVTWPAKLRAYMDNMSALGDVPLYDSMAL
jgi:glutaredoxin 2